MDNILFVFTDQWRADCMGYRGHKFVKTPNLDKLAKKSIDFQNSYSICPLCTPARGALFTGLYPHQSGVIDNCDVGASTQEYLPNSAYTWLDAAVEKGYKTGHFGKWHLGLDWQTYDKNVDFDMCRIEGDRETHEKRIADAAVTERGQFKPGYPPLFVSENEDDYLPFYGRIDSIKDRHEYKVTQKSLEFLEKNKDEPWCLTASLVGPHFPSTLPQEYYDLYSESEIELPESLNDRFINKPWFQSRRWWPSVSADHFDEAKWRKTICAYYGCITMMDELIGQILDKAEACSGGRKTRVIFTADHGEMLGAHSRFDKSAYFYDDVIRTPLLLCDDLSGAQKSTQSSGFYNTLDIAQTFFAQMGKKAKNGIDLFGQCAKNDPNKQDEQNEPKETYSNYYKYNGHSFEIRGISTQRYKYSFIPQDIDELYDLQNDPHEMVNLSDSIEHIAIKEELKAKVLENMKKNGDYLLDIIDDLPQAGTIGAPEYPDLLLDY